MVWDTDRSIFLSVIAAHSVLSPYLGLNCWLVYQSAFCYCGKSWEKGLVKRKGFFWLTALEVSVPWSMGPIALGPWGAGTSRQERVFQQSYHPILLKWKKKQKELDSTLLTRATPWPEDVPSSPSSEGLPNSTSHQGHTLNSWPLLSSAHVPAQAALLGPSLWILSCPLVVGQGPEFQTCLGTLRPAQDQGRCLPLRQWHYTCSSSQGPLCCLQAGSGSALPLACSASPRGDQERKSCQPGWRVTGGCWALPFSDFRVFYSFGISLAMD